MPRIILDCDPGTDDALALLLAIASPELDLAAITVAAGNSGLDVTLRNALGLARLAGCDAPVHRGADRPLLGRDPAFPLPEGGVPAPCIAADAIRAALRDAAAPLTLVGIAPATNLALALMTEPALAERVGAIVLMSGAWGEGNATPAAEFNALADPEALAVLLRLGRPVVLASLGLTDQALVTPPRIAALRAHGGGHCLRTACDILASVPPSVRLGGRGAALHDPCAIAWLLAPDLFTWRDCPMEVDLGPGPGRGRTLIDRWGKAGSRPTVRVLETLDADGFFTLLGSRLARLP
jgi:inosine-uridine nucleoside N-ribohydrolase